MGDTGLRLSDLLHRELSTNVPDVSVPLLIPRTFLMDGNYLKFRTPTRIGHSNLTSGLIVCLLTVGANHSRSIVPLKTGYVTFCIENCRLMFQTSQSLS